ncbi:MAG: hypothetical protein Q8Q09_25670 [Deltaproteobacteria bacterium]|nr:hypothetical protein [Deltaproteobacteria bacterium]
MKKRRHGQHGTCHRWTQAQITYLTREWGEMSQRNLARELAPHTWYAIRERAKRLGLHMGVPQGRETLNTLAPEFGVDPVTLRKILREAGVQRVRVYPLRRHYGRSCRYHYERDDARDAFDAWLALETLAEAARRMGVSYQWLRKRALLTTSKQDGTNFARRAPTEWDELAARFPRGERFRKPAARVHLQAMQVMEVAA